MSKAFFKSTKAMKVHLLFLFCFLITGLNASIAFLVSLCLLKPNWSSVNRLSTVCSIRLSTIRVRIFEACVSKLNVLCCSHFFALAFFCIGTIMYRRNQEGRGL